ncbi:unnamed protein product [Paramecium octaurelia]|uniref:Uncharacterized protein n=1 Tax=Paramecium octaurelia TaxID=43137 RepID=A0A8S1YLL8_PAROT|nr:unnamed protein product [Paramecium octaurelia]
MKLKRSLILSTTSNKSKKKNSSTTLEVKPSLIKQKEYINQSKDDPKDKLSPELKPFFQHQNVRTKAEKMQEKHNLKQKKQKLSNKNEAGNIEQDDDPMYKKEQFRKNKDNSDNTKQQNNESNQQHVNQQYQELKLQQRKFKKLKEPTQLVEQDKKSKCIKHEHIRKPQVKKTNYKNIILRIQTRNQVMNKKRKNEIIVK